MNQKLTSSSFLLSPELLEYRDSLRRLFERLEPASSRRKRMLSSEGVPITTEIAAGWKELAELGALSAHLPERAGGVNLGLLAAGVTIAEGGRALTSFPLFESLAFSIPLLFSEEETETLSDIGRGSVRITGVIGNGEIQSASLAGKAVLNGEISLVPSVQLADRLIVPTSSGKGGRVKHQLCIVDLRATGNKETSIRPVQTLELLRSYARVRLTKCPARIVECQLDKAEHRELAVLSCQTLAVCEMIGATEEALRITTEYVQTRKQFGRAIGSFQAIQQKLADAYLELEKCTALTHFALWCFDNDRVQFSQAALAAIGHASEMLPVVIERCLQAHGGIGFTFEYDLHLYLRRVRTLATLYGGVSSSYRAVATQMMNGGSDLT